MTSGKAGAFFGLIFLMISSLAFFGVAYNLSHKGSINKNQKVMNGNTLKLVITEKSIPSEPTTTIITTTQTTTTPNGKLHKYLNNFQIVL